MSLSFARQSLSASHPRSATRSFFILHCGLFSKGLAAATEAANLVGWAWSCGGSDPLLSLLLYVNWLTGKGE